jgi:type II secretory pathway predicted ATPase ExeA
MPYRARALFFDAGLSLSELAAERGYHKSTWSRLLAAKLDPEPAGIRTLFEEHLVAHGVNAPRDLWQLVPEGQTPSSPEQGEIGMRGQSLLEEARAGFRLFRNPFDPDAIVADDGDSRLHDLYLPTPHRFAESRLLQALTGAGFLALYGEPGSGKSTLLARTRRAAAERRPLVVVNPANIERRKMGAMHIAAEIIRQLSDERVPRIANMRDHVATEVLKQRYAQGQRIALVIDEAHELPTATIKDLKRYHELADGFVRLLAVILVGQSELARRFELERNHELREAIIRCQLVHLPPMRAPGDVRRYMETRFRWVGAALLDVWETEAVDELERRLAEHDQQIPVLIGNVATAAMNLTWARHAEGVPVTQDEVIDVMTASAEQLRIWGLA